MIDLLIAMAVVIGITALIIELDWRANGKPKN